MPDPSYAEFENMDLEVLQAAVDARNNQIAQIKEDLRHITPILSARQKEANEVEAAKSDPRLTQGIGLN